MVSSATDAGNGSLTEVNKCMSLKPRRISRPNFKKLLYSLDILAITSDAMTAEYDIRSCSKRAYEVTPKDVYSAAFLDLTVSTGFI